MCNLFTRQPPRRNKLPRLRTVVRIMMQNLAWVRECQEREEAEIRLRSQAVFKDATPGSQLAFNSSLFMNSPKSNTLTPRVRHILLKAPWSRGRFQKF